MIAICFVVHNQLKYTKWFIESIAKHSYPHALGFFILDNGSSDGTWEWLNTLKLDPLVLGRNAENESLSKCWNRVLNAGADAGADILCLTNNDIVVGPGWLDGIVEQAAKSEKAYWLPNGAIPYFDFDKRVRERGKTGKIYPGRAGWCMFFKKDALHHFLPIPEELRLWYGDDFIHWQLRKAGYECLTVDDCCAFHFGSKTVETIGKIQHIIDADKIIYNRITGDHL